MAKFYIQLENQRLPIGEITREEVLVALGIDELFNFTGNFYDLDDNPFSNGANGEFNIVDEEGRIIAIVDEKGIHSIEMTAEDESGTVHKLTDKMDKADFDEIISMDGNDFVIQDEDGNKGFVLNDTGAKAKDFITSEGDSLLDVADRVESIETNVGSLNDMISTAGNEFIIQDDKDNPNIGLKLNSEGLFVKDVTLNNGEHVLSQKADKTYVDDVKSDMTTELNTKINSLDATVSASGRTHGVKVSVTQTNGKLSSVSVDDSKIDFTKLTSNPIDVNEESQSFVIKDGRGNKGFVLNDKGAKAKDFTTSTGVSLNGLNTTVVSIRTEVDNINNMISAEEEGALIIKDGSGNKGLVLDSTGLQVQDVTAGIHTLSSKADKEYVDEVDRRLADIEGLLEEDNDGIIDNLKDVINFFASVRESDKGAALLSTVATHTTQISDNASDISTNASNITTLNSTVASHKKELDGKITTLSNLVNTNKNEIDNTIASLTTTVSGSGSTHGVTVKVEQNKGLITKVSVNDSTIDFYRLASNPIENKEDDKFVITDESGRYGLKLDSTGLHVRDVIAHGDNVNGIHTLSSKADRDYVDGSISDVNAEITTLAGTVSALSTRVSTTEKNITSLSGRVSANEGDISGLSATVGTHTTTITTLNSTVASHKKELEGSISDLTSTVASNKDELNGKITALSKTVASNKVALEGSISNLSNTVASHTSDIATINASIASHTKTITSLSGRVSSNEGAITKLNSTVGTHTTTITTLNSTVASHALRISANENSILANTTAISNINNITSASATINSNVGTPTVTVSYTGETSNKKLNFEFKNLKGDKGDTGTSVSVSTVTSSSDDGGTNTVTFTDGNKLYVKNGSKGSTGAGISAITKKGTTNNLVDTYEITYTDGRTATSFTVTNGAPGTSVTITSVSQNNNAGESSKVTFSDGKSLSIKNGQNGSKGSDGYSTYYTANTYASDHKTISQGVVTKPSERTIQIGDFILASNGNMFRVTGAGSNLSVDYITSIVGPEGPQGKDGTSVNIKDTLSSTDALADKKNNAVNGDGYIIGENLYVYTGGTTGTIHGFKDVGKIKGPQGEPGPQGPEGPAGTSVTIKSLVSSSAPGEASTITFSDDKILKVYNGADGAQGPAGVGISKISKSGETVTITYTDTTTSSFTVNDGVDGTSVTITSVSQNNTAGESSTVTFSDGKSLSIKNGQNGSKGSDGYSTYYTANTYASDHKTISQGVVTKPSERTIQIGDFILASNGNMFRVTGAGSNLSVDYITSIVGPEGPQGKDGRSITSITAPSNPGNAGKTDTYTINYSDNTKSEFTVYNGKDGGDCDTEVYYEDILNAPITNTDDDGQLHFADINGNVIATINNNGIYTVRVAAANGFYQESDETLKDFYEDVNVDFDVLKSIPKSYYTWKGDDVRQIGTSAQKVQEVYPELVSLNEKTGKLTLDYAKLSIVALKAVDLISDENKKLNSELETLRNEIDMIKSYLGL